MLLVDAIFINEGGGKVLLDYFITKLEDTQINCLYLLDKRIEKNHPKIKSTNQVVYLNSSLWDRFKFYRKHRDSFSKIFCLGNLPPSIKMKAEVFTYFHSPLYLKTPKEFSKIEQFKYVLKRIVLKTLINNTDFWLVQSKLIKGEFQKKFKIKENKVSLMPFYPPFRKYEGKVVRESDSFLYVSNAYPHKNHIKLIDAFCAFFDEYKKGKLILTVSDDYMDVLNMISDKIDQGYPIVNVGFVDRNELVSLYLSCQYLIFPSLAESFGLGLVEAIDNDCKVMGADLPYTYAVCEPSIVFNPYKVESIIEGFKKSLNKDVVKSKSLIKNRVDDLIELLN